jgi:hypothetical protein
LTKEFGQAPALAGVENAAEVEDAIWEWGEKGVRSKYFKRWFGDWELARDLTIKKQALPQDKAESDKAIKKLKEDAKKAIDKLRGKEIKNLETGTVAQINTKQRNKLLSKDASDKSKNNGFEIDEHYLAAGIIDKLFEHAVLVGTFKDEAGDVNVESIKRFVSPFRFGADGAIHYAYLTVKKSVEHGHKVYSLELQGIEKLGQEIKKLGLSGNTLDDKRATNPSLDEIIERLNTKVKELQNVSKAVDEKGLPLFLYHGTRRPDRVGDVFDPKRATSGPMAFWTTSEEVAWSYANNKEDTSLYYDIDPDDVYSETKNGFVVNVKGKETGLTQYGKKLTRKQNDQLFAKIKNIGMDEDSGNLIYGNGSFTDNATLNYMYQDNNYSAVDTLIQLIAENVDPSQANEFISQALNFIGIEAKELKDNPFVFKKARSIVDFAMPSNQIKE